jgi:hypothetical protein
METLMRFLYNPFSFSWDFDRTRRKDYHYYGEYKPTKLKRLMIWLMNERIEPIDWEEVPPFKEEEFESELRKTRRAEVPIYECHTSPNMLTQNNIYFRRILLAVLFYAIYRNFERNKFKYRDYAIINFYVSYPFFKWILIVWIYYMTCRSFVHKDYQMPYN